MDANIHRLESRLSYRRKREIELEREVAAAKNENMVTKTGMKRKYPVMLSAELQKKRGNLVLLFSPPPI